VGGDHRRQIRRPALVLAELREAGADLQSIISRRAEPGKGVVFVTPLRGDRETAVAAQVGFNVAYTLHSVRIMAVTGRASARS